MTPVISHVELLGLKKDYLIINITTQSNLMFEKEKEWHRKGKRFTVEENL